MIIGQFGWWNLWLIAGPLSLKAPADLGSISNARASRAPAIFLLAQNDEVVAPRFQTLIANAYAGEKILIPLPHSGHNSPISDAALLAMNRALDHWFLTFAVPNR